MLDADVGCEVGGEIVCVENIMFTLIRSEICNYPVDEHLRSELTIENYKELFCLSRKHDLSHIVASGLFHAGLLGDDEMSQAFHQELMRAVYRDAQRDYAISLTNDLLEQAQIPHINLKGSVIRHMYPQSWMRTSCDIDILIHKSDIGLVEKILCENNYIRLKDSSTHDYNFVSPNKIHIEVHHTLTQDGKMSLADELLKSVWDDYTIPSEKCIYRNNITQELFVVYHLAHMGRHLLHGGCGIRPVIDLWLINKQHSADPQKLDAMLTSCNLKALYDATLELSRVWLESHKHNEKTEQFERYILCGGVYGSTTNAAKMKAANGVSKGRSFFNLMFLSKENLEVLYPALKKYPILYPFYQIKRWFRYFDKNKRNKVKHLIKQRNIVTDDEINRTTDLLNQLGLI